MKIATLTVLSCVLAAAAASAQSGPVNKRPAVGATGTTGTTAPAAAATSAASTAADYRLTAGDKLRIDVYKDPNLSQSLQIRPDGKITMPLVGDLSAAGHTPMELRDAISAGLKDYIKEPVVTVIVLETAPQVVYVTGEVNKPGALTLVNGRMSVVQAIAMAGGFTDFAKRKDVLVMRKSAKGMETLHFNYKEAIDEDSRREPLQLVPGDTVIVK